MAAPTPLHPVGPYTALPAENYLDTNTPNTGQVRVDITITLTGSVSQVQADYTTLAAVSVTSPSATIDWH